MRKVRALGGAFVSVLVVAVLVGLGGASACWAKPAPVRDVTISVDQLQSALTPAGVRLLTKPSSRAGATPAVVDVGMTFNLLGAVAARDASRGVREADHNVRVRTSPDGVAWGEWVTLSLVRSDEEGSKLAASRLVADPCWVGEARYVQFSENGSAKGLKLVFINSLGEQTPLQRVSSAVSDAVVALSSSMGTQSADAVTVRPNIVTRAQWGADESVRRCDPEYAPVRMAFIHHTVNGNGYSRAQAPALIRAVYYYHVRSCGWNDIGYNFIIDRFGTIYEGRYGGVERGPIGGHVLGFNTNSTGISLLGTYTNSQPSAATRSALARLLAWKLDVHHVNPASMAVMTCHVSQKYQGGAQVKFKAISGHRDANFTTCPGGAAYAVLPTVQRSAVAMGLPKIYAPAATSVLISPNGDGIAETTTLSFAASEAVSWGMAISDGNGAVVRSFTGVGSQVSRVWDGKNKRGAVVPDGFYTVTVTAKSARGVARPASFTIIVDVLPPVIESFTASPTTSTRLDNGRRQPVSLAIGVSLPSQVSVDISSPQDLRAATVLGWRSLMKSPYTAVWDGTVNFAGIKIPAPDGTYTAIVRARDGSGLSTQRSLRVVCKSDPTSWGNGFVFVTRVTSSPTVKRGKATSFRYVLALAPPLGQSPAFSTAKAVAFRVRDAAGTWCFTKNLSDVPLNKAQTLQWTSVPLSRGTYRTYVFATLADGTKQQLAETGKLIVN